MYAVSVEARYKNVFSYGSRKYLANSINVFGSVRTHWISPQYSSLSLTAHNNQHNSQCKLSAIGKNKYFRSPFSSFLRTFHYELLTISSRSRFISIPESFPPQFSTSSKSTSPTSVTASSPPCSSGAFISSRSFLLFPHPSTLIPISNRRHVWLVFILMLYIAVCMTISLPTSPSHATHNQIPYMSPIRHVSSIGFKYACSISLPRLVVIYARLKFGFVYFSTLARNPSCHYVTVKPHVPS